MTKRNGLPPAQGLYDPRNEHDACGVGFLANIKGRKSHDIILRGAEILCRLTHRGAVGADPLDGDGAGLMIQIPDAFYRAIVDFPLPPEGDYATAILFLPKDDGRREACERAFDAAMERTGLATIGWRDVPTDSTKIGRDARSTEPLVRQVFVARGEVKPRHFEMMCYLARRRAEGEVDRGDLAGGEYFYVNSFSSRRVLYKGMLLSDQLVTYYPELSEERVVSAVALVHQRYSTNTFPTWDLAQPFRFLCHNGEINTVRGNINWMRARQAIFEHDKLGRSAVADIAPVILRETGSDTACFDNALDLLVSCGFPLEHAMAMMIPEAWQNDPYLDDDVADFFRYHAHLMEPWDGPANIAAFDGTKIVAALDRNGLRPVRYWITENDEVIYASEAGVLDVDPKKIVRKGRLAPGKMLRIDTEKGTFTENDAIKKELAAAADYGDWLREFTIRWKHIPPSPHAPMKGHDELRKVQKAFSYTLEDMRMLIAPMCRDGKEPIGSMGIDTPIAVLSDKPKLLYWYFKQAFAQVTNPAIDPIREELVMSLKQYLGSHRNLLHPGPENARLLEIDHPVLSNDQLEQLRHVDIDGLEGATLDATYPIADGAPALESRLDGLGAEAERHVDAGRNVLIVSDRGIDDRRAAIPALLAISAIHHHLIRAGKRMQCSLIAETGEAREVHHFALLCGYGAEAVNPYLAFDTIEDMVDQNELPELDRGENETTEDAVAHYVANYVKAIRKGLFKVFSKIGISTLQSYHGAQIFECVGLRQEVVDRYFAGTATRIGGAGLSELHQEIRLRHRGAFAPLVDANRDIEFGGEYHWRRDGELHISDPEMVSLLQHSARMNDRSTFKRFCAHVDDQAGRLRTIRGLFKFRGKAPIDVEEVEPVEAITKRFCTGAMSLGSISTESHETLAIAMNRLGGKSNTGEGGEDARRYERDENGDWRRSFIKQVASGRFGVTPHYLVNSGEMQIKIAQGAKPGEGGQLPGHKVTEYIAKLRHSVPGVGLISPPPHHDIYSIEDLAQLIFDLKNCNPEGEVSVKLVSIVGVGTVAAGVAKGHADTVIIAGYDGGTGASPLSSIKHAGVPWEIGLAETQQTLVLNDLRGRIRVQTDGQIRSARDVVIAALLGAEEFGVATGALIAAGCIMMRKCHLDTCPVGIATQDPELRKKYHGKPEDVVNYFTLLAEEVREVLASIGVRSIDEIVGRGHEILEMDEAVRHWKSKGLDFSRLLAKPDVADDVAIRKVQEQDHGIEGILDRKLIDLAKPALEKGEKVEISLPIKNFNRTTCTMLSGRVAKLHGAAGLPPGTITIRFEGVAGQSFGCFLAEGIDLFLRGEANDYAGKGQSGGRIAIYPDPEAPLVPHENSVVGNTVLYGATGGRFFAAGQAGERFCVRNSGVQAVVEGVGDHGCEYMTGGVMVCLGPTGKNFGAGMSGGFAYVLDEQRRFGQHCNMEMIELEKVVGTEDVAKLRGLIEEHVDLTGSEKGRKILEHWDEYLPRFVKVFPKEYRRALAERAKKRQMEEAEEVVHG